MSPRVLLIGGAGYIGGLTADLLKNNNISVSVYDNILYEDRFLKEIDFIYGDVRDTKKIVEISKKFDVVVLLAALVGDPACSVNPELTNEINFLSVKRICEKLPKSKHVIFMSTCSVYGAQDGILTEESPTNPLSVYASTKLDAEKYVLQRDGTIFRLGTVYGLGDVFSRLRMDLVVNVLTMKAHLYGEITINDGNQYRPIIAVRDIANYILEAVQKKPKGIYVLAKENVKIKELGERVAIIIPNTKINYQLTTFQDARNYQVDFSKALESFEYKPVVTVEEEVNSILNLLQTKRIKDPENYLYHNGLFIKKLSEYERS